MNIKAVANLKIGSFKGAVHCFFNKIAAFAQALLLKIAESAVCKKFNLQKEGREIQQLHRQFIQLEENEDFHFENNKKLLETAQRWLLKKIPLHEKGLLKLEERIIAFKYRSGMLCQEGSPARFEALEAALKPYLKAPLFPGRTSDALTVTEREQVAFACTHYPEFVAALIRRGPSDPWVTAFVKWALRSECDVAVFVETVHEREQISRSYLDKRSGAEEGRNGIHFIGQGETKTLAMRIDGTMEPIQGRANKERVVQLRNLIATDAAPLEIKIGEIFKLFAQKSRGFFNVEWLQGGVRNWNTIELGSWNPTHHRYDALQETHFLSELEKIPVRPLRPEEFRERYPQGSLEDGQTGFVVKACREREENTILAAHGYFDVVLRKGEEYFVYTLGMMPKEFPATPLARFLLFSSTKRAALYGLDEARYMSHRQHRGLFFALNAEERGWLNDVLSNQYQQGKRGELYFQFVGHNCAYHVQNIFNKVVGRPLLEGVQEFNQALFDDKRPFHKELKGLIARFLQQTPHAVPSGKELKLAFEGLSRERLEKVLPYIAEKLISEGKAEKVYSICKELWKRIDNVDLPELFNKTSFVAVLVQTIELIRFYKKDGLEFGPCSSLLKYKPTRFLYRAFVNVFFFFLGSWRSLTVKKEGTDGKLERKCLLWNTLTYDFYLHVPTSLWTWEEERGKRIQGLERALSRINN